ncbi:hypothetical protein [Gracilibacillus sp. YIM 98692]|nr:hypothetical protein [Gracilibacillus sp. YIM 98692]
MMNRFTIPREIYFGENSLDKLKELEGKKCSVSHWRRFDKEDG